MTKTFSAALAAATLLSAGLPAQAATMTFDNLTDPFATSYSENGITATGNGDMGMYSTGSVHIDDGGTSAPSQVNFTMAAGAFDAISFDLQPLGFSLELCDDGTGICTSPSFENAKVEGFSGATLVASLLFDMGPGSSPYTVALSSAFRNLPSLTISVVYPVALLQSPPAGMSSWCDSPCSHFEIDNVTLNAVTPAPVPLPAGLPLAASGLVALGALALRRRKRA